MDLHCKRCPQCISDILLLTADINSFRVKYFKPKKKSSLFKKGALNIVGIFMVSLNAPGYSQRFSFLFFPFFFTFSHLSLSTHLSYDASNLVWFAVAQK